MSVKTPDDAPAGMPERSGREGMERLIVPSHPSIKTFIPFGMEGTSAMITPFGEILRISQFFAEDDPRIICLTSPALEGWERDLVGVGEVLHREAQARDTGLTIRLIPTSGEEVPSLETRLEWINGRWPCIHYEFDGFLVSVLFTIVEGFLLQEISIVNPSEKDKAIRFALQIGDAQVNTLYVENGRWAGHYGRKRSGDRPIRPDKTGTFRILERKPRKKIVAKPTRGEALITVFHDGSMIDPPDIVLIPSHLSSSDSDDEDTEEDESGDEASQDTGSAFSSDIVSEDTQLEDYEDERHDGEPLGQQDAPPKGSELLQVPPKGVQRLVMQYKLHSYGTKDRHTAHCQDPDAILKRDQASGWSLKEPHPFNPIFRRYLEHILCLSVVNLKPDADGESLIPFINDITLDWVSSPVNDFYIFRYLLLVHELLATHGPVSRTTQSTSPGSESSHLYIENLKASIKNICRGHIRWTFRDDVFLSDQSWPLPPKPKEASDPFESQSRGTVFHGSLQILKLFEFAKTYKEETPLVDECLRKGTKRWLTALTIHRDLKSRLWYKDTKRTYIDWTGRHDGRSEWLDLPDYRLGDLIYIWKALQCLEELIDASNTLKPFAELLTILSESDVKHSDVRKTILRQFIYQPSESHPPQVLHQRDPDNPERETRNTDAPARAFAIAVRRSRERNRLMFTAKDTMLYDGFEWGFFEDDISVETLTAKNEIIRVGVQQSWRNTIQFQGGDHEAIWHKPLRYALAIMMTEFGSLDNSKSAETLEEVSWERLLGSILPNGLFVETIDSDTKLPEILHSGSHHGCWEIPTLLLRRRYQMSVSKLFGGSDPSSASLQALEASNQAKDVSSKSGGLQISDNGVSRDARVAMRKKFILEKKKKGSQKKVDLHRVHDPIDRKMNDWLYPLPGFLRPVVYCNALDQGEDLVARLVDELTNQVNRHVQMSMARILRRGLLRRRRGDEDSSWNWSSIVVSIGQLKDDQNHALVRVRWGGAAYFERWLSKVRTVGKAKKRFHISGPLKVDHALVQYTSSPVEDRQNIAIFFSRHSSFSNHVHDHIHPVADVWVTELHLGFLQLVNVLESDVVQKDFIDHNVCKGGPLIFPRIVEGSQFDVYKASLSYRFLGDMGDKYWSAHFLSYLPGRSISMIPIMSDLRSWEIAKTEVEDWFYTTNNDQRRILEPFLVEKMVAEIARSIEIILTFTDDWLDPVKAFSKDRQGSVYSHISKVDDRNFEAQHERSTTCLELNATLNMLLRHSKANVDTLREWKDREANRRYKPRWSEKDDLKYQDLVDHHKGRAEKQISNLIHQFERIEPTLGQVKVHRQEVFPKSGYEAQRKILKISQLIENLNLFESRAAAHESENIRIFTYTTVIFYPLSFVASLFSMQGRPNHNTTISFLQATAIALVVTFLVIFNAWVVATPMRIIVRRLRSQVQKSNHAFWSSIAVTARGKMEKSSNMFPVSWANALSNIELAEYKAHQGGVDKPNTGRFASKLIYLLFLLVYSLVEYPAIQIALAYDTVARKDKRQGPIALDILHVFVALVLIPVFVVAWITLVVWNVVWWISGKLFIAPHVIRKEFEGHKRKLRDRKRTQPSDDMFTSPFQGGGTNLDDRSKGKLIPKKQVSHDFEDKVRQLRLQEQVSLLINPPKLYNAKLRGLTSRTNKKKDRTTTPPSSEIDTSSETADMNESPRLQMSTWRSIWPFAKQRTQRSTDDEVSVTGRDA